ncbi:type II toxin-antitoxin system VapC family toxin [Chamaesiphon sp. VAR_48_metabat_403]|uniref:type II toxin-antitoxin system VapC family toxin n=1 Tax=Chamaesiphon sp. VAR_48_metabat_403 TaxID=2964700 RepID=UPI00286E0559|nr:type II toxin-antitoxin system VapC family toxin [Chamaesiphon sp. VAR_48_metabat_403]
MTNLLLDTHAFIWYSENDPKLPESIKIDIENADRVYLSIASLWEIAIKLSIGKLSLRSNYESIEASLEPAGISLLPISFADTVRVMNLPLHHRDPFDRILIAQAIDLSLTLISCDAAFAAYPIQIKWG